MAREMTTEEAIEYLTRCADGLDPDSECAVSMAVSALREKQTGGWISVKDRLPEQTGKYLATYKIHNGSLKVGIAWFQSWEGESFWNDCAFERVTHWQPLPELPKE